MNEYDTNTINVQDYPMSFVEVSGADPYNVESKVRTLYEDMEKYLLDDNGSGVRPDGLNGRFESVTESSLERRDDWSERERQ